MLISWVWGANIHLYWGWGVYRHISAQDYQRKPLSANLLRTLRCRSIWASSFRSRQGSWIWSWSLPGLRMVDWRRNRYSLYVGGTCAHAKESCIAKRQVFLEAAHQRHRLFAGTTRSTQESFHWWLCSPLPDHWSASQSRASFRSRAYCERWKLWLVSGLCLFRKSRYLLLVASRLIRLLCCPWLG